MSCKTLTSLCSIQHRTREAVQKKAQIPIGRPRPKQQTRTAEAAPTGEEADVNACDAQYGEPDDVFTERFITIKSHMSSLIVVQRASSKTLQNTFGC